MLNAVILSVNFKEVFMKYFSYTAKRTRKINVSPYIPRGGINL